MSGMIDFYDSWFFQIDPKPCSPKHVLQQKKLGAQFPKTHKVFLGGISMEASEDDVREHFSKYGSVSSHTLPVIISVTY